MVVFLQQQMVGEKEFLHLQFPRLIFRCYTSRLLWAGVFYPNGYATGSLPTCNGTTEMGIVYDTTTNKHVGCNGSTWDNLY